MVCRSARKVSTRSWAGVRWSKCCPQPAPGHPGQRGGGLDEQAAGVAAHVLEREWRAGRAGDPLGQHHQGQPVPPGVSRTVVAQRQAVGVAVRATTAGRRGAGASTSTSPARVPRGCGGRNSSRPEFVDQDPGRAGRVEPAGDTAAQSRSAVADDVRDAGPPVSSSSAGAAAQRTTHPEPAHDQTAYAGVARPGRWERADSGAAGCRAAAAEPLGGLDQPGRPPRFVVAAATTASWSASATCSHCSQCRLERKRRSGRAASATAGRRGRALLDRRGARQLLPEGDGGAKAGRGMGHRPSGRGHARSNADR